jgi:hypothetical protein
MNYRYRLIEMRKEMSVTACRICGSGYINHLGYCFHCKRTTINLTICPSCDSVNVNKNGFRTLVKGKRQRYQCMDCGRKFIMV